MLRASINDKQEETFATIIHCVAEVEGQENYEEKLEKFLLEIVRVNETKSLFLSGAFPMNLELDEFTWLTEDKIKRGKRYWHEKVIITKLGIYQLRTRTT